jgi:predicted MFS family arabinose efflux permease
MTNVLFIVFPPVWVASRGIPVSELTLYYPIVGAILVVTRIVVGRRLDRIPRGLAFVVGAIGGTVALVIAALASDVAMLTLAGAIYAGSSSFVSPTASALAIDRADPQRRGAAMATYSMGFPLGNGAGAVLWGAVIGALGFPAPFVVASASMAAILALVYASRVDLLRRRTPAAV